MKKSLLLLSACAVLFVGLTSCNQQTGTNESTAAATSAGNTPAVTGSIVYVQMDSLLTNYEMYKELATAFQEKSGKAETDLTNRGRGLEREILSAQDKVQKGLVTSRQAQTLEEELGRKQQSFVSYREQLMNELAEEEQVMMNRIFNSINKFLKEFNNQKGYGMIISTSGGSPVMIADPSLDITTQVLEGLNQYYTTNKEKL